MNEVRWHCVDKKGMARPCANESDAKATALHFNDECPFLAPFSAVQLVDAAEVERLNGLLSRIHADLLMRAAEDETGKLVVNLSRSIWEQLKEALK